MAATRDRFADVLEIMLVAGEREGFAAVEISAGALHRRVGGYPGPDHRMPVCCDVLRAAMQEGDVVVDEPDKGKGASLQIRYALPR